MISPPLSRYRLKRLAMTSSSANFCDEKKNSFEIAPSRSRFSSIFYTNWIRRTTYTMTRRGVTRRALPQDPAGRVPFREKTFSTFEFWALLCVKTLRAYTVKRRDKRVINSKKYDRPTRLKTETVGRYRRLQHFIRYPHERIFYHTCKKIYTDCRHFMYFYVCVCVKYLLDLIDSNENLWKIR